MLDSASRDRPSRTLRARSSPTPSTTCRSSTLAESSFCRRAEVLDQPVDDGAGQPRAPWPAAGSPRGVTAPSRCSPAPRPSARRDGGDVDAARSGRAPRGRRAPPRACGAGGRRAGSRGSTSSRSVVDAGDQLLELQGQQPAVGAELEHVVLDLAGDPGDHLQPLGDHGDVADGDQVLDLQRGQRAGDLVEPELVALERGQRLVGAGQDLAGVLEHVADLADVDRDDLHRLRHRDHRVARSAGRPGRRCGAGCRSPRRGSSGSGIRCTAAR